MSYSTVNFSDSEEGLFTPSEIRDLMRIEYDRARRYGYTASAMLIAVDRLEYLHDLYGWESKEEILASVIRALRSTTRNSDFLGCMSDDRVMAVFPHTDETTIGAIATRLLGICRQLDFRTDGRSIKATVSIGVATLRRDRKVQFDEFLQAAEEAVAFALSSGGDRFCRRESATDVIGDLREEIEREAQRLVEEQQRLARELTAQERPRSVPEQEDHLHGSILGEWEPGGMARPAAGFSDLPETDLGGRLRGLFRRHARSQDRRLLEDEVVRVAEEGLRLAREAAVSKTVAEHSSQIDLLERRLTKLKDLLDVAEGELAHLASIKGVDAGIASIYRTVQGLSQSESQFAQKKEMLSLIFEANLELQKDKKKRGS